METNTGEVAEWSNAAVLKTVERESVPGVRIPVSPPLTNENPFSVFGRRWIFLLFSKVVATGLLTAGLALKPEMVLSPPVFSKAVD
jgi:hypothetical protein